MLIEVGKRSGRQRGLIQHENESAASALGFTDLEKIFIFLNSPFSSL